MSRPGGISAALALVVALAVAGCGSDDDDGDGDSGEAPTELSVTLDRDGPGGEDPVEASLRCPEGGPAATVSAPCAAAGELTASDADPVPPDAACTKIYGGPDIVTLRGTLEGEEIDAELTRTDGCQIERFGRFLPLLEALFPGYEPGGALKP